MQKAILDITSRVCKKYAAQFEEKGDRIIVVLNRLRIETVLLDKVHSLRFWDIATKEHGMLIRNNDEELMADYESSLDTRIFNMIAPSVPVISAEGCNVEWLSIVLGTDVHYNPKRRAFTATSGSVTLNGYLMKNSFEINIIRGLRHVYKDYCMFNDLSVFFYAAGEFRNYTIKPDS
jgi:hypothetical protein